MEHDASHWLSCLIVKVASLEGLTVTDLLKLPNLRERHYLPESIPSEVADRAKRLEGRATKEMAERLSKRN